MAEFYVVVNKQTKKRLNQSGSWGKEHAPIRKFPTEAAAQAAIPPNVECVVRRGKDQ